MKVKGWFTHVTVVLRGLVFVFKESVPLAFVFSLYAISCTLRLVKDIRIHIISIYHSPLL